MEKLLATEAEAMEMLSISRSHLRRLDAVGTIHHVNIGKSVRYRVSDLELFVAGLDPQPEPDPPTPDN